MQWMVPMKKMYLEKNDFQKNPIEKYLEVCVRNQNISGDIDLTIPAET